MEQLGGQAPGRRATTHRPVQAPVYLRCPYLLTDYFGLIVPSIAETLDLHGRELLLNAGEAVQPAATLATLASRTTSAAPFSSSRRSQASSWWRCEHAASPSSWWTRVPPCPVTSPPSRPRISRAHAASPTTWSSSGTGGSVSSPDRTIGSPATPAWPDTPPRSPRSACCRILFWCGRRNRTAQCGHAAACDLLDLRQRPTALIGFNDKAAVGAMAAAPSAVCAFPDDLSVAGFDDIDLARATGPMLTTVRQPLQEMGRMAVSLLIRLLERQRLDALHIELATELIVRGSTGRVPTV